MLFLRYTVRWTITNTKAITSFSLPFVIFALLHIVKAIRNCNIFYKKKTKILFHSPLQSLDFLVLLSIFLTHSSIHFIINYREYYDLNLRKSSSVNSLKCKYNDEWYKWRYIGILFYFFYKIILDILFYCFCPCDPFKVTFIGLESILKFFCDNISSLYSCGE